MGLRQLEAAILRELREVTGKKGLRQKDIMEWSNGEVAAQDGEVAVHLPTLGVWVAYKSATPPSAGEGE